MNVEHSCYENVVSVTSFGDTCSTLQFNGDMLCYTCLDVDKARISITCIIVTYLVHYIVVGVCNVTYTYM